MKKSIYFWLFWVILCGWAIWGAPALWALELDLSGFPLIDQQDQPLKDPSPIRYLLFAGDQASFELVSEPLHQKGQAWLEQRKLLVLADIHKMPRLISKLFALPEMRKLSFRLFLDRDGSYTEGLAHPPKRLVLFDLNHPKTENARQIGSFAELEEALKP